MATETSTMTFSRTIPPFPSDIPSASLARLSSQKLASGDESEIDHLLEIAKDTGFFYLDLQDTADGRSLLDIADRVFEIMPAAFDIEDQHKVGGGHTSGMGDKVSSFKKKGNISDENGAKDWTEIINLLKDDILLPSNLPTHWPTLHTSLPLLNHFVHSSRLFALMILSSLNNCLNLHPSTLSSLHRLSVPSGDTVRLTKAWQDVDSENSKERHEIALPAHRDAGTVTILFNRLGGLQMQTQNQWQYVKPLPGHAVVNLGDAMSIFTNGQLKAGLHRVLQPPGEQKVLTRWSLVYFLRPEDEAMMRSYMDGEKSQDKGYLTAREWAAKRFAAIVQGKGTEKGTIKG